MSRTFYQSASQTPIFNPINEKLLRKMVESKTETLANLKSPSGSRA